MAGSSYKVVSIQGSRGPRNAENEGGGQARFEGTDAAGRKVTGSVTFEEKDAASFFIGASITL